MTPIPHAFVRFAALLFAATLAVPVAQAQKVEQEMEQEPPEMVEGVLRIGQERSGVVEMSAETGDLVGHAFANRSATGKLILNRCLPDFTCRLTGIQFTENTDEAEVPGVPEHVSGWLGLKQVAAAEVVSSLPFDFEQSRYWKSRFGPLQVNEEDGTLWFRMKQVQPVVEQNSSMHILLGWQAGAADMAIIQIVGGTACPALFRIARITQTGISVTPEFGNCSGVVQHDFPDDDSVELRMAGFVSSDVPEQTALKTFQTVTVYRWKRGILTRNGQPVPAEGV